MMRKLLQLEASVPTRRQIPDFRRCQPPISQVSSAFSLSRRGRSGFERLNAGFGEFRLEFGGEIGGKSDEDGGDRNALAKESDHGGEEGVVDGLQLHDRVLGGERGNVDDALDISEVGACGERELERDVEGEAVQREELFLDGGEFHVEGVFAAGDGRSGGAVEENGGVQDVGESEGEKGFVGKTPCGFRECEWRRGGTNCVVGKNGLHKMEKLSV